MEPKYELVVHKLSGEEITSFELADYSFSPWAWDEEKDDEIMPVLDITGYERDKEAFDELDELSKSKANGLKWPLIWKIYPIDNPDKILMNESVTFKGTEIVESGGLKVNGSVWVAYC